MTDDERDRILGLLSAGPADVARLSAGLGLPGGVVSYLLKLLERDGLVRVSSTRGRHGTTTTVYVSTAAAATPPLPVPPPLPGLTWTGDGRYPAPVWTAPRQEAGEPAAEREAGERAGGNVPTGRGDPATGQGTSSHPTASAAPGGGPGQPPGWPGHPAGSGWTPPAQPTGEGRPPQHGQPGPGPVTGPRFVDVRRVPLDDATFYEFATRLDALAQEFAARATPGAPAAELTIAVRRPAGGDTAGYGS